jgi:hypothetical protein
LKWSVISAKITTKGGKGWGNSNGPSSNPTESDRPVGRKGERGGIGIVLVEKMDFWKDETFGREGRSESFHKRFCEKISEGRK